MLFKSNFLKCLIVSLGVFACTYNCVALGDSDSTEEREGKLKAACIYYLAKFVHFPEGSLHNNTLNVCVLGDDSLNTFLSDVFKNKVIKDTQVNLITSEHAIVSDYNKCNVLHIGEVSSKLEEELLLETKNKPILTVSGSTDYTDRGGLVHIAKVDNKLKIRINLKAAEESKLQISSELLQISEIVDSK